MELLRAGYASYERGDDAGTVRATGEFLAQNERSSRADEAYYLRGLAKYRMKDSAGAKSDLNQALSRTQRSDVRLGGWVALGELAYENDDIEFSENAYRQALTDAEPSRSPADRIHYRLGCILQRQGRWKEADGQFNRLIELFGDSELAKRASRRVHCRAWTVQAGAFGVKARADDVESQLRGQKLAAFSQAVTEDGRLVFVVQVGRHATYDQALSALADVRGHMADAFVTVTR